MSYSSWSIFMGRVTDWLRYGWHLHECFHTSVWLIGLVGLSSTSIVAWGQRLQKFDYLWAVLLAQTVIWLLVIALAIGYVGYRARKFEAASKLPVGMGGAGGTAKVIGN